LGVLFVLQTKNLITLINKKPIILTPLDGLIDSKFLIENISFYLDPLSLCMSSLIALLGAVIFQYSRTYLEGEKNRENFLSNLVLTVLSAQLLVLSGSLVLFAIAWILLGLLLHKLLLHYHQRPRAQLAARKKFIISRIGDTFLIVAIILFYKIFETISFEGLYIASNNNLSGTQAQFLPWALLAILLASMCKSAQLPFHSWLPDTLEAPTPVSAIMHAGIINGGGFIIIRLFPLFNHAPTIMTVMAVVGLFTAVLGLIVMWGQTTLKKRLAWSTVSQMGFMFLECGMGAYSLAVIHMIAHGFYKAHAFLNSGTPAQFLYKRQSETYHPLESVILIVQPVIIMIVISFIASQIWDTPFMESWSGGILGYCITILALSLLIIRDKKFSIKSILTKFCLLIVTFCTVLILKSGSDLILQTSMFQSAINLEQRGLAGTLVVYFAVFIITLLTIFSLSRNHQKIIPIQEKLITHAINGFYLGLYADRLTRLVWPVLKPKKNSEWSGQYE
jgi:NAD(P)H-quinone oxidoreductase subunit 5